MGSLLPIHAPLFVPLYKHKYSQTAHVRYLQFYWPLYNNGFSTEG